MTVKNSDPLNPLSRNNPSPTTATQPTLASQATKTTSPVTKPSVGATVNPSPVYKPTDNMGNNMNQLLNSDSLYMQQARQQGMNTAASRGLLNSSIAAGAAQQQAINAALPIAQQDTTHQQQLKQKDTTHQQQLKQMEKQVQANIQGAYLDAVNKVMNNAMINFSEIETADGIQSSEKNKMISNTIKRRDADMAFLKNMYSAMPTWSNNWTSFPNMPSAPGVSQQ